jgi:hypothetical protein
MATRSLIANLRSNGAFYLATLLLTFVVGQFAQHLWPTETLLKGQPASTVVNFAGFGIALLLWWIYRPRDSWPPVFAVLLVAWAVLWGVVVGLSVVHDDLFNLTAFLVLPILAMIWLKKPSLPATFIAGDVFASGLVVIALASQVLIIIGVREISYQGWNRLVSQTQAMEFAYRYFGAILGDWPGPMARWSGPFGNVNYAGPIGAFLLVYGLLRPWKQRVVFVLAGVIIVLTSDSRTSVFSCAVGVAALIALSPRLGSLRAPTWLRIAAPATVAMAVIWYIAVIDPTLNQRTPVWQVFVSAWKTSPVVGVGGTGLQDLISGGTLAWWANHGHSMLVDPLARYGVVGVAAVMAVIAASGAVATQATRIGFAASGVLLVTCLADGFSEDLVDWRYIGLQGVPMMFAVMLGGTALSHSHRESGVSPPSGPMADSE